MTALVIFCLPSMKPILITSFLRQPWILCNPKLVYLLLFQSLESSLPLIVFTSLLIIKLWTLSIYRPPWTQHRPNLIITDRRDRSMYDGKGRYGRKWSGKVGVFILGYKNICNQISALMMVFCCGDLFLSETGGAFSQESALSCT